MSPILLIGMLYRLPDCKKFWVLPSDRDVELWKKLVFQFARIDFGPQVVNLIPQSPFLQHVSKMLSKAWINSVIIYFEEKWTSNIWFKLDYASKTDEVRDSWHI